MTKKVRNNPKWKVIATDTLGVFCLLLVPIVGPLPGPGGIPLLLAGFGLLATNHDWADGAVNYVKKNSQSLRDVIFPNITWVKWAWDIFALLLLIGGTVMNFNVEHFLLTGLSIGIMASSSTIFFMNRDRISWLDAQLRRTGKK